MIKKLFGLIQNTRSRMAAGLAIMILSVPASAVPLLLEGPISNPVANPDGSGSITVLGVVVFIPAGITIVTPTATLTMAQVADPTPLPGRTQPGFVGGTAIINGTSVGGVNTADDMFLEPAENILGADITGTGPIKIAGVELAAITDARLPADPVTNDFGFEVDPTTISGDATAEGYFPGGASDVFQYFLLTVTGGDLINPGVSEVSITRAQCIGDPGEAIELRIQGGVHNPATGTVTIKDFGPTIFGTVEAVADVTPFGLYSFRLRNDNNFTICPASVTVEFNGVTAVAAVSGGSPDVDGDGVRDAVDNCTVVANGPLIPDAGGNIQLDSDTDGYGNICDADLTNDGAVNLSDFSQFRSAFGSAGPDADFNGDGSVNLSDFSIFRSSFGSAPGPSCCGILP